jgi:ribosomal protein S20
MGQQRGETAASKWAKNLLTKRLTRKDQKSQVGTIVKKTQATNEANKIWSQGKGGS